MIYKCLKKNTYVDETSYEIVPLREEDIERIRLWRNLQMEVLRQKFEIQSHEQNTYFHNEIWPTFVQRHPKQILFSYLYRKMCIGYGGLTHIDWESSRAEISFLVDPKLVEDPDLYEKDFSHFLNLLSHVAFDDLNLHRLFTETFIFRTWHIQILEKCGFQLEGTLRDHIYKEGKRHCSLIHGRLATERLK